MRFSDFAGLSIRNLFKVDVSAPWRLCARKRFFWFDLKKNPCIAQKRQGAEKNKITNWAHCRAQYTPTADFVKVAFGLDG